MRVLALDSRLNWYERIQKRLSRPAADESAFSVSKVSANSRVSLWNGTLPRKHRIAIGGSYAPAHHSLVVHRAMHLFFSLGIESRRANKPAGREHGGPIWGCH